MSFQMHLNMIVLHRKLKDNFLLGKFGSIPKHLLLFSSNYSFLWPLMVPLALAMIGKTVPTSQVTSKYSISIKWYAFNCRSVLANPLPFSVILSIAVYSPVQSISISFSFGFHVFFLYSDCSFTMSFPGLKHWWKQILFVTSVMENSIEEAYPGMGPSSSETGSDQVSIQPKDVTYYRLE